MARQTGVKKVFLMKDGHEAWEFVDDNRPALAGGIDRRYARYDEFGGWVWFRDDKEFDNAKEGNDFYLELLERGFKPCTEAEVLKLRRRAANGTY